MNSLWSNLLCVQIVRETKLLSCSRAPKAGGTRAMSVEAQRIHLHTLLTPSWYSPAVECSTCRRRECETNAACIDGPLSVRTEGISLNATLLVTKKTNPPRNLEAFQLTKFFCEIAPVCKRPLCAPACKHALKNKRTGLLWLFLGIAMQLAFFLPEKKTKFPVLWSVVSKLNEIVTRGFRVGAGAALSLWLLSVVIHLAVMYPSQLCRVWGPCVSRVNDYCSSLLNPHCNRCARRAPVVGPGRCRNRMFGCSHDLNFLFAQFPLVLRKKKP